MPLDGAVSLDEGSGRCAQARSAQQPAPAPSTMSSLLEVAPDLDLDGRLALVHRRERWLAVADLHFGYEAGRRRDGALWPMWGMGTVSQRLAELVGDHRPETLVLVGDVVDGAAAEDEAVAWLRSLEGICGRVVLVEGNHDRGAARREFEWVASFSLGEYRFEHGHRPAAEEFRGIRVSGHLHPSVRMADGAGASLRLPALAYVENAAGGREFVLPAFSPWAGGGRLERPSGDAVRLWACSPQRVFELPPEAFAEPSREGGTGYRPPKRRWRR